MFQSPIPACVFFSRENFISYAEPPIWHPDVALRFTAAVCAMSRLLAQILFHCKMMPISKAVAQWLWSGSSVIPAGKVIWVGSYFQPAMLPGILQGAATVL